eukprot:jgi/Ulvmu1/5473/UM023_0009.1
MGAEGVPMAWGRRNINGTFPVEAGPGKRTKQCYICFADQSYDMLVQFLPCKHDACVVCMEDLRKEAIRKTAKGVNCPFCRTFVDQYEAIDKSNKHTVLACEQASRTAARAARARLGILEKPTQSQSASVVNGWPCAWCESLTSQSTEVCQTCGKPRVDVQARPVSDSKRIIDMSPEEVRTCALAKFFPRLARAFTAMHVDIVDGRLQQGPSQAQAALVGSLPRGHGEEFFFMATRLATPLAMKQLSYHFYGNYFAQAMLTAAAHVRDTADRIASTANPDITRVARSTFGMLMRQLQGEAADMARHPQARFVLELLIDRCEVAEAAQLAEEMGESFAEMVVHKWGSKLLQRLATRMVAAMEDPDVTEASFKAAQAAVDRMCASIAARPAALAALPTTLPTTALLKQVVELGCPGSGGLRLAQLLMNLAPRMLREGGRPTEAGEGAAYGEVGVQCVCLLVQIEQWHVEGVACLTRDMLCLLALRLTGEYAAIARGGAGTVALLSELLHRLGEHQEADWLDFIMQELLQELCDAGELEGLPDVSMLLARTLASPLFDDDYADGLLAMVEDLYPEQCALLSRSLATLRVRGQPQPLEQYYAPSVLQPTLIDEVRSGQWAAPPAPPGASYPAHTLMLPASARPAAPVGPPNGAEGRPAYTNGAAHESFRDPTPEPSPDRAGAHALCAQAKHLHPSFTDPSPMHDSILGDPMPEDPYPEEPMPEDPYPEEPMPEEPYPEEPIPEDPDEPIPEEPYPEEPIPEEPYPEEPIPEEPYPEEPIPEDPDEPIPEESYPEEPIPEEPYPEEPIPEDLEEPIPEEPYPEEPIPEESNPEDPIPEDPLPEEPIPPLPPAIPRHSVPDARIPPDPVRKPNHKTKSTPSPPRDPLGSRSQSRSDTPPPDPVRSTSRSTSCATQPRAPWHAAPVPADVYREFARGFANSAQTPTPTAAPTAAPAPAAAAPEPTPQPPVRSSPMDVLAPQFTPQTQADTQPAATYAAAPVVSAQPPRAAQHAAHSTLTLPDSLHDGMQHMGLSSAAAPGSHAAVAAAQPLPVEAWGVPMHGAYVGVMPQHMHPAASSAWPEWMPAVHSADANAHPGAAAHATWGGMEAHPGAMHAAAMHGSMPPHAQAHWSAAPAFHPGMPPRHVQYTQAPHATMLPAHTMMHQAHAASDAPPPAEHTRPAAAKPQRSAALALRQPTQAPPTASCMHAPRTATAPTQPSSQPQRLAVTPPQPSWPSGPPPNAAVFPQPQHAPPASAQPRSAATNHSSSSQLPSQSSLQNPPTRPGMHARTVASPLTTPGVSYSQTTRSHGSPVSSATSPGRSGRQQDGDAPAGSPATAASWSCGACTYIHAGREALFLTCAMCGSARS